MKRYILSSRLRADESPVFTEASAEELRALLLFALRGEPLSAEDVAEGAVLSLGEAKDALAFWRGAGVIKAQATKRESSEKKTVKEEPLPVQSTVLKDGGADGSTDKSDTRRPLESADELPSYSGGELASILEKKGLAAFIETCQQTYGKVLSTTDINTLIGLHEQLHFECEYICLLLAFCVERGRKPMRYVEKVAFSLYDRGILTVPELEKYIEEKHLTATREGKLRRLFGIGERALTAKEEEAFSRWCTEYGYDDAVIGLAYDITVGATAKASVSYADRVLTRFHTAGCKNEADAMALIAREKTEKAKSKGGVGKEKEDMRSFEVDDMFAHALDRSYGKK